MADGEVVEPSNNYSVSREHEVFTDLTTAWAVRMEKDPAWKDRGELLALFLIGAKAIRTMLTIGAVVVTELTSIRQLTMGQINEVAKKYDSQPKSRIVRLG